MVKQMVGEMSNRAARRSIFMQDNVLSDLFRHQLRMGEQSKKFPTGGPALARVAKFLFPIVRVPTNIGLEAGVHMGGLITGTGKLLGVMSRGLKNIKPEEADMIMRHYSKGAIGAGLFLTGYFNADNLGGFYSPHREEGDPKWGEIKIGDVKIPKYLLHAPAFLVMQAGATARKLMEEGGGPTKSALSVARGLTSEIPFVNEMGIIDDLLSGEWEGRRARGNLLAGSIVPQGVKNIAQWTDPEEKRKPQTELDYVKMGIPWLREQVQTAPDVEAERKAERRSALRTRLRQLTLTR
jgi:hypothetical protein